MITKKLQRLIVRVLLIFLASYGFLWQILEPILGFIQIQFTGPWPYIVFVSTSLLISVFSIPRNSITLKVNTGTIKIQSGDIFKSEGCRVIAVNEFFDSQLGNLVSPNSLHGKFINEVLGGQSASFDSLVSDSLRGIDYEEINREEGNNKKYPIGTTSVVECNGIKYFLFALCQTEMDSNKAFATKRDFKDATDTLLKQIRAHHNGCEVNIPLFGTGLSGVDLNPQQILNSIILAIKLSDRLIAKKINIIIYNDLIKEIDFSLLKQDWN
jgi:hypothetical protein